MEFTVSLLLTRDEYVAEQVARVPRMTALTPLGGLIALGGAAAGRFWHLPPLGMWGCVILGAMLAAYDCLFSPMLRRAAAIARYEQQESLRQTVYLTVTDGAVRVTAPRFSGPLPPSLTVLSETAELLVLTLGGELTLRLPKRQLSPEQQACLRERFQKE